MLLSQGWRRGLERYREQECERYRTEERKGETETFIIDGQTPPKKYNNK